MEETKPWLLEMITYIGSFIGSASAVSYFFFKFKKVELEAKIAKDLRDEELKKITQKQFIHETLEVLLKTPLTDIDQNIKKLSSYVSESNSNTNSKISKIEDRIVETNKRIDDFMKK